MSGTKGALLRSKISTTAKKFGRKSDWGTLVPRINVEKTVLNWDVYGNKCIPYIKIGTLLKHYYTYSKLFIEFTQNA
jgi:hypothetical protein